MPQLKNHQCLVSVNFSLAAHTWGSIWLTSECLPWNHGEVWVSCKESNFEPWMIFLLLPRMHLWNYNSRVISPDMFALQMDKYTVYPNFFLFFLLLKQIETNMSSNYTLMYGSLNGKNTLRSSPISLACFMGNVMRKTTGSRAIPATIPQVPHTSWQCWWNISIRDCSFDTFQYMFNLATDFFFQTAKADWMEKPFQYVS